MDLHQQENIWIVCLNCEYEYNMDELFSDNDDVSCPLCESKSYRTYTELGEAAEDVAGYYHRDDFANDFN